ncbi:MAG: hypothetical protein ACUVQG_03475 [Thermogutta sp.]
MTLLQILLNRIARSLPCYIAQTRPWVSYRREGLWQVIEEIASRHRELSVQLSEEITRHGGVPEPGGFPLEYARYNDLAIEYVAAKIFEELEATLKLVQQIQSDCYEDPKLSGLLQQIAKELTAEFKSLEQALYGSQSGNGTNHSVAA